jgi:hypothetical protein
MCHGTSARGMPNGSVSVREMASVSVSGRFRTRAVPPVIPVLNSRALPAWKGRCDGQSVRRSRGARPGAAERTGTLDRNTADLPGQVLDPDACHGESDLLEGGRPLIPGSCGDTTLGRSAPRWRGAVTTAYRGPAVITHITETTS